MIAALGMLRTGLVLPVLFTFATVASFIALGTWQLERRAWKETLIAKLDRRLADQATPLPPREVWANLNSAEDEFRRVSIPTATNVPGAELVLRVHDLAPSPATTVVVNCAGRTRSIIGAQSLINAGVPNKVVALRNGTMGWSLAGFVPDHNQNRRKLDVSVAALARAKEAAARVAARHAVPRIEPAALEAFRADQTRTVYLLDVRSPEEYVAGHLPGALSAPGGQLVQATDQYAGTLGARIGDGARRNPDEDQHLSSRRVRAGSIIDVHDSNRRARLREIPEMEHDRIATQTMGCSLHRHTRWRV